MKNVAEDFKVETLFNLVSERAKHLLVYANADKIKDYQKVKALILKEFTHTLEACFENFIEGEESEK